MTACSFSGQQHNKWQQMATNGVEPRQPPDYTLIKHINQRDFALSNALFESVKEAIKQQLGFRANCRKIKEINEDFQLRADIKTYVTDSDWNNCDIGRQNTYFVGANDVSTAR